MANTDSVVPAISITSLKDLEKDLSGLLKVLDSRKETEADWELREKALLHLGGIIKSDSVSCYKKRLVQGLHDLAEGIVVVLHSLRTSLSLKAISLITDIGVYLGSFLDAYTFDTFFSNLLRCSSQSKKIIATHIVEATVTFLSTTIFHSKTIQLLWTTLEDKNSQLRHFASIYLRTILETHGPKESSKAVMERTASHDLVDRFLRKGLLDAAPLVREVCRQVYWVYYTLWKTRAESIMYALEPAMQKQLIKCQPNGTPLQPLGHSRISMPMPPRLRVSGIPPERSRLSAPALPLQMGAISRTPHSPSSIHSTMARSTGKRTPLSRQNSSTCVSFVEMSPIRKRSFAETFSQETSSLPKKHTKHINPLLPRTRVPSSSSSPVDTTAAPSILHMLQSDTVEINCKALHTLAEKLKDSQQDPLGVSLLPPGVPSRIDLLPLLVSYITQGKKEIQFYKILMDWESLTSIFIHVFSLNHYVPSLIKAEQAQIHTSDMSPHELLVREIYAKGLKRLKIILKRTDPLLTPKLLTLVQEKLDDSRRREMISRVNKDHDLIRGLLEWIDELVCDYVGLGDEDPVLLEEGRCWIKSEDGTTIQALEWFENATNIVFCLNTFLPLLQRISSEPMVYEPLMPLIGHLRLCNQRVFEKVSQEHGRAIADILQKAFYTHPSTPPMLQDSLASPPYQASLLPLAMDQEQSNLSMSKLLEECSSGPAGYTLENLDESTGMTYDISKIAIDFKKYHSQDRQSLGAMRYELEWPDLPELDKEEEMTGIADILDLPMSPSGSNHSRLWTNNDRVAEERREDTFMSLPFETHMHSPSESQSQLYSPLPQSPSPLESHSTLPLPLSSQSQPPLESQSQSQIYSQPHSQQHSHSKSYSKSHSQPHSQPHSPLESHSPLPLPLSSESYPMSSFSPSHSHLHSPTDPTELQRTKYLDTNFPLTQNDRLLFLKTSVYRIQQQEALTPILFTHLQRLSRETAFDKTHYDTTTQVWKYLHHHGMDIESLVNGLIVCFKDTSRLDRDVETEVILLIKSLLVHQSVLFQHYNQTDPTESMETHLMYRLMEVLIHSKVTILQYGLDRSDTLSAANDALDTLLSLIHPSIVSNILWSLLDKHIQCDKDTSPSPVQTCTLSTLFSYLGQLAPRIPAQCLEESLQKNAATLLLQGINHTSIPVRKTCVDTLVGIHHVLGDSYLKTYLTSLRSDQLSLLKHYISENSSFHIITSPTPQSYMSSYP